MSFRLVPKLVTLNDLERRNGVILRCFSEFGYLPGALRKSSRSLSHLLTSSCKLSSSLNFLEDTAKGAQHPPPLDPCLLRPRSPISATAKLL